MHALDTPTMYPPPDNNSTSTKQTKKVRPLAKPQQSPQKMFTGNMTANPNLKHKGHSEPQTVDPESLIKAALYMKSKNVCIISKSCRQKLNCFEGIDFKSYSSEQNVLFKFRSRGKFRTFEEVLRPMSIKWPYDYNTMVPLVANLDSHLINTNFKKQPFEWIIERDLAKTPECNKCKKPLDIEQVGNFVRWTCQQTDSCKIYSLPIQKPSFFNGFEAVPLDKLLFSIYYWSLSVPIREIAKVVDIKLSGIEILWRRLQVICQAVIRKNCAILEDYSSVDNYEPYDLISIKVNSSIVICAKHPNAHFVRLAVQPLDADDSELFTRIGTWFPVGATVRVTETKFLRVSDPIKLKVLLEPRHKMMNEDENLDERTAFGYLVTQLAQIFMRMDSSSYSHQSLELLLAELEWREQFGTNPFDAFFNIIKHLRDFDINPNHPNFECAIYKDYNLQPIETSELDQIIDNDSKEYLWVEKYFYATLEPNETKGNSLEKKTNLNENPQDVYFQCHECNFMFDSYAFVRHIIQHIELHRKDDARLPEGVAVECKHCFKIMKVDQIEPHSSLFRSTLQRTLWGCRICCIEFKSRVRFLAHMRKTHFQYEMPYACPLCPFKSSFQRDVFLHFQTKHATLMSTICPLCLASFTFQAKPKKITRELMFEYSKILYQHLLDHYNYSKSFKCDRCCLCFLNEKSLSEHKKERHNPMKVESDTKNCKFEPYTIAKEEKSYCVKALPNEIFVSNKKPNSTFSGEENQIVDLELSTDEEDFLVIDHCYTKKLFDPRIMPGPSGYDRFSSNTCSDINEGDQQRNDKTIERGPKKKKNERMQQTVIGAVPDVDKYLSNNAPSCIISANNTAADQILSSEMLIELMSKLPTLNNEAGFNAKILGLDNRPIKCAECRCLITPDHYVGAISCLECVHRTHCPRAALRHKELKHSSKLDDHSQEKESENLAQ